MEDDALAALDGLRGVAAVWVLLHHCAVYGTAPIDLQGSSIMPLFFLLSGFTLVVAYSNGDAAASYQVLNVSMDSSDHHTVATMQGLEAGRDPLNKSSNNSINDAPSPPPPPLPAVALRGGGRALESTWLWWLHFQQNRLARVYPLYLAGTLSCLVFWLYGYGSVAATDTVGLTLSVVRKLEDYTRQPRI